MLTQRTTSLPPYTISPIAADREVSMAWELSALLAQENSSVTPKMPKSPRVDKRWHVSEEVTWHVEDARACSHLSLTTVSYTSGLGFGMPWRHPRKQHWYLSCSSDYQLASSSQNSRHDCSGCWQVMGFHTV